MKNFPPGAAMLLQGSVGVSSGKKEKRDGEHRGQACKEKTI